MIDKAKVLTQGARKIGLLPKPIDLSLADVELARNYVANYWYKLERHHPKDNESLLGLPNPYLMPSSTRRRSLILMNFIIGIATSWSRVCLMRNTTN